MARTADYEKVTDALIKAVQVAGHLPWEQPWKTRAAVSMSTGKPYRGGNQWVLGMWAQATPGWSPWFGTYKKIAELGGQVRKGEKSLVAYFWKFIRVEEDGETKTIPMLKTYNVFNAAQADGLPEKYYQQVEPGADEEAPDAAEVFDGYVGRHEIKVHVGGAAFYTPATDAITLPEKHLFKSVADYYGTAFHEAAHSTGHPSRLNRPGIADFDGFGSHQYSREELVAEMTAAIVAGVVGVDTPATFDNHAAYLKNWLKALADDPQALVWAAGRAEKAADLILGDEDQTESEDAD